MAKGDRRGLVRFRKPLPKTETPVKDRLREIIASRNDSSESVDTSQPATPPASVIETIGSWITGRDSSCNTNDEMMYTSTIDAVAIPGSPTPLSKKARKRIKKRGNQSTEIEPSTPIHEGSSAILDDTGPQLHLDTSRTTSFQSMDGSVDLFPIKALHENYDPQYHCGSTEKRDSVISSNWEGNRGDETLQSMQIMTGRDCTIKTWRKVVKPSSWWPCQLYRWLRKITLAIVRSFQGHHRADLFLSLALLLVCTYVAYAALDFVLCDLIKGVKAQDIVEATNCSVVYVTVPGPVVTVSLIAGTTSDPVQSTYSYSIISGITEWPGSITPPSLSDDPATRSLALTSGLPSVPSFTSSIQVSPSTLGMPISPSPYPGVETTFITTSSSGNTFMISTVTLLPSSVILSPVPSNSPVSPSASSLITNTPTAQPSQPYPSPIASTTSMLPSMADPTTNLLTNTMGVSVSSPANQGPDLSSNLVGLPGPAISSSIVTSLLTSDRPFTNDPIAVSGTTPVATNSVPGGSVVFSTTTSMVPLSGASPNTMSIPTSLSLQSSTITIGTALPDDPASSTLKSADPSTSLPLVASSSIGSLASQGIPVTITSILPDGRTTVLTMFPTNVQSTAPPVVTSSEVTTAYPIMPTTMNSGGQATTITEIATTVSDGATSFPTSSLQSDFTSEDPSLSTSSAMFSSASSTASLMEPAPGTITNALTTIVTRTSSGQMVTFTVTISPIDPAIDGSSTTLPTLMPFPESSMSSSVLLQSSSTTALWSSASPLIPAPSPLSSSIGLVTTVSSSTAILSASSILYPSSSPTLSSSPSSTALGSSAVISESSANPSISLPPVSLNSPSATSILPIATFTMSLANPGSASNPLPVLSSSGQGAMPTSSMVEISSTSMVFTSSITPTAVIPGFNFSISSILMVSSSSLANTSTIFVPSATTSNLGFNTSSSSRITPTALSSTAVPISNFTSTITLVSSGVWSSVIPGLPITNSSLPSTTNSSLTMSVGPSSNLVNTTSNVMSSAMSSIFLTPSSTQNANPTANISTTSSSSAGLGNPTSATTIALSTPALVTRRTSTITLTTSLAVITSAPPPRWNTTTSALQVRALITRVISYGDTSVVFVFPTPTIVTTITYWTGTYPTVTGPEPSDIQSIPLSTRSIKQTPLSELPSFGLFASTPTSFKTVVNTIVRDAVTRTQTKEVPASEPTDCGEHGNFTLSFDDMTVGTNASELLDVNGMKNPYHHLFYANGFTYVPDKWEPYPAISQPNIAMFLPLAGRLLPNTAFAGTLLPGEIGAGPRASVSAYWFNAYSGFFGCALNGLAPCTLRISGYRYDDVLKQEVLVAEQNATLPACLGYINCQLTQVFFNEKFIALSGIQFNAFTNDLWIPQVHMMDDLQMEWWNNTCSAGILRIGRL